jgi:hypothetical protein
VTYCDELFRTRPVPELVRCGFMLYEKLHERGLSGSSFPGYLVHVARESQPLAKVVLGIVNPHEGCLVCRFDLRLSLLNLPELKTLGELPRHSVFFQFLVPCLKQTSKLAKLLTGLRCICLR